MSEKCPIVKDLLPLYIDELCSEQSAQFIEGHLKTCEHCDGIYKQMLEELDIQEEQLILERTKEIQPFEKISKAMKAQQLFTKVLKTLVVVSMIVTVLLLGKGVLDYQELTDERAHQFTIEEEQEAIMRDAFNRLEENGNHSLAEVSKHYNEKIKYLAVFKKAAVAVDQDLTLNPKIIYPLPYEKAEAVYENGIIVASSIVPNSYDIGTMAMEQGEYIVQFEYQDNYLDNVERGFQTKHYAPESWQLFIPAGMLFLMTMIFTTMWLFMRNVTRRSTGLIE